MYDTVIWGTTCSCGTQCSILTNEAHPLTKTDFAPTIVCSQCNRTHTVTQPMAQALYTSAILARFNGLSGHVIDFGSGGGFLSWHACTQDAVKKVTAIDIEPGFEKSLAALNCENIDFFAGDETAIQTVCAEQKADMLISRDVVMFVKDVPRFIDIIDTAIAHEIRLMGWFLPGNDRMKNQVPPKRMASLLKEKGWKIQLELLDWYSYGYLLVAKR